MYKIKKGGNVYEDFNFISEEEVDMIPERFLKPKKLEDIKQIDTSNKNYAGVLYTNRDTKYVETYDTVYISSKTGDAVYETSSSSSSTTSWDSDCSYAPNSTLPVFFRGGYCSSDSSAGVFYFDAYNGGSDSSFGFRPVLSIK